MNSKLAMLVVSFTLALLLFGGGGTVVRSLAADDFAVMEGMWVGALDVGTKLRLVLKVEQGPTGWLTTIDSIDQGALGLGVKNMVVKDGQVSFELQDVLASYSGKLVDADHIEGFWKQGMELPLSFERTTEEVQLNRPQEPKEPFPYAVEEVAYSFDPDDISPTLVSAVVESDDKLITLRGTLTLPPEAGPHPCVLLITGSGPQDRNETLMNHQPFWVLADYLSRRGLAVLRVDDRGTGQSTGNFALATTEDFAKDATAGFLYLQRREDIAGDRVALLGHSEGGLIAPLVAVANPEVAAIVLMAGTGVDGMAILRLQLQLIMAAQGASEESLAISGEQQDQLFQILGGNFTDDEMSTRLAAHFTASYEAMTAEEQKSVGSRDMYLKLGMNQVDNPWMRWFLTYDPVPTLGRVACPVLAVNGGKDLQVDPEQNLPAIEAALAAGAADDYQIVRLPGLNHLFQNCQTGAIAEYGQIEETLAPEFLELVTGWLQERLLVEP